MDAELVRLCPTSMGNSILVLVLSCFFFPSYRGTGRHIIRVGFVFRSSHGDDDTWISQKHNPLS